ncbi:MAG TPA: helix-turn-helix domain-containing protein, partial [Polyangiaceae bacterium]|nr:helix-turn-helix domain-containing protein [Polyangiaceae bacterium]
LEARGDVENALFARLQSVRRLVLLGELRAAERALAALELRRAPPLLVTVAELAAIDIAVRSVRARDARLAVERARAAARAAAVPSLTAEVEHAARTLDANVARLRVSGAETAVRLDQVEDVFRSRELVVDACRREVRSENVVVPLIARPVLLALAVTLAESSPAEATREALARRTFGARAVTESVRARLRVEIGRLRRVLGPLADVRATLLGFSLVARRGKRVLVLLPPDPGESSAVLALLGGEPSWSTSGLARALGKSQRTVQRALGLLLSEGRVEAVGKGSARRWMAAAPTSFATTMLLLFRDSLD